MLFQVIELIRQNLNVFITATISLINPEPVVLVNIAFSTPDNPAIHGVDESAQIYMSIVRIEEKATRKNQDGVRQSEIRSFAYGNPPFYINLFGK
jgi:hypothetical protein